MSSQLSDRRLFEYFIVAGLTESAEHCVPNNQVSVGKATGQCVAPITDICVIFPGEGETVFC